MTTENSIGRTALDRLAADIAELIVNSDRYSALGHLNASDWARALPAALRDLDVNVTEPRAPFKARRPATQYPFLDKGDFHGQDDTEDVPAKVYALAEARMVAYKIAHNRHYPPTPFDAGSNSDRQCHGTPGHCSVCAIVGHVLAHPERGCPDVGCDSDHTSFGQITRHTCTADGKAMPFGRKAPMGECLRCDQLRAGAPAREAHPAIQAGQRRRAQEDRDERQRRLHFTSGDHQANCGRIPTCYDW